LGLRKTMVAAAAVVGAALALCGCSSSQANGPPLPEISSKNDTTNGRDTMSNAQQKKAIDDLIAKRDAK
jgi:hypothetical protein